MVYDLGKVNSANSRTGNVGTTNNYDIGKFTLGRFAEEPQAIVEEDNGEAIKEWIGINPKTYLQESIDQVRQNPFTIIKNAIGTGYDNFVNSFKNVWKENKDLLITAQDDTIPSYGVQRWKEYAEALGADMQVVISPITTVFAAASEVPILKQGVDAMGLVLTPVGKIAKVGVEKFIDVLPISQESKDTLKPAFGELGSTIAQLTFGAKILDMGMKKLGLSKQINNEATRSFEYNLLGQIYALNPELAKKLSAIDISKTSLATEALTILGEARNKGLKLSNVNFSSAKNIKDVGKIFLDSIPKEFKSNDIVGSVKRWTKTTKTSFPKVDMKKDGTPVTLDVKEIRKAVADSKKYAEVTKEVVKKNHPELVEVLKEPKVEVNEWVEPVKTLPKAQKGVAIESIVEKPVTEPIKLKDEITQLQEYSTRLMTKGLESTDTRFQSIQKGRALEFAAIRRMIDGKPTEIEFKNVKKYLETNYRGKQVEVDGKTGEVTKPSFGKIGVKFEDGTTKYVSPENITSKKVSNADVINYIKEQGRQKLEGQKSLWSGFKFDETLAKPITPIKSELRIGITSASNKIPEIKTMLDNAHRLDNEGRFKESERIYNKILDIGESVLKNVFKDMPYVKIEVQRSKGNFFGEVEPTFPTKITFRKSDRAEIIRRLVEISDVIFKQENVHLSTLLTRLPKDAIMGVENSDGSVYEPNYNITFEKPLTDKQYFELSKEVNGKGLAGSTLSVDRQSINLYNISKLKNYEEFIRNIKELGTSLDTKGIRTRIQKGVRKLYNIGNKEYGATRTYDDIRGELSTESKQAITNESKPTQPPTMEEGGFVLPEKEVVKPKTQPKIEFNENELVRMGEEFTTDPRFQGTSFKEQIMLFTRRLMEKGREWVLDIATGRVRAMEGESPSAFARLFSSLKDLTKEEAKRLTDDPYVVSIGGQELSLGRIGMSDNPIDVLKTIKKKRTEKANKDIERKSGYKKNEASAKKEIRDKIEKSVKKAERNKYDLLNLLDELGC